MRNSIVGKAFVAGALLTLYFLLLTHRGINTTFTGDDVMNLAFLHGYGRVPLGTMFVQSFSIFTPEYRPVGGLYYRTLFALFGFHPLPFRVVFFTLLITNILLAGVWFRRLSGSGSLMAAACAVLLFSFHPMLAQLFYDNGTVYDVLCLFFVLLLLNQYVRTRSEQRFPGGGGGALLCAVVLYGAALGSKEMAVTLPAVFVLYEIVFHPHLRDLRARIAPIALLTFISAGWSAVKTLVPSQMSVNPQYAPHFQIRFIGNDLLHYYQLLFLNDTLSAAALAGILILALSLTLVLRSRPMLFGFLFANLTLLPVCVVAPRAGFVWYMSFLGIALYFGTAVSLFADALIHTMPSKVPVRGLVFVALVCGSYALYSGGAKNLGAPFFASQRELSDMLAAVRKAAPTLPHGARILVEDDTHTEVRWLPLFLLRLGYQDATIWVDRVPNLGRQYDANDVSLYEVRVRWDGSHYRTTRQPQPNKAPSIVTITPDVPDVLGNVRRGQCAQIHLPQAFANCSLDVAYRMPDDELQRGGVWLQWAKLDAAGNGVVQVNVDAERGRVVIDRARACGGAWVPADGSFVVDP